MFPIASSHVYPAEIACAIDVSGLVVASSPLNPICIGHWSETSLQFSVLLHSSFEHIWWFHFSLLCQGGMKHEQDIKILMISAKFPFTGIIRKFFSTIKYGPVTYWQTATLFQKSKPLLDIVENFWKHHVFKSSEWLLNAMAIYLQCSSMKFR